MEIDFHRTIRDRLHDHNLHFDRTTVLSKIVIIIHIIIIFA